MTEALQIFTNFIVSIAYSVLIFLAITTWARLRRMESNIAHLKHAQRMQLMLTMGDHLRDNFSQLNDMQQRLEELVEDEHFEEAEKLKALIDSTEKEAFDALKKFKEEFGDDVAVEVTNINRS